MQPVTVLHTFHGNQPGATFGWAVSELRDVTGDGVEEAIIGEPFRGADGHGRAYVYAGSSGALLFRESGKPGDALGYSVADAGDENGDGVTDFAAGAPGSSPDAPGKAYVYSGASGRRIATYLGTQAGESLGYAVSSAGDVDGDGVDDLLVGAPGYTGAAALGAGRAFVFSGRTHRLLETLHGDAGAHLFGTAVDHTADINGDGVDDLIVGAADGGRGGPGKVYVFSGRTGRELFSMVAPPTGRVFGNFFVAGVGDVNGDGTPDIYAADYGDTTFGPGTGRAAVFSGVDGSQLLSWTGSTAGEGLGPGREAGDVNGDGRVDLVIGSYNSSDGAPSAGKVQVFSGADGSLLRTITSTTPGEQLGFDAVGVGDQNGDGIRDLLVSAASGETVYLIAGERSPSP